MIEEQAQVVAVQGTRVQIHAEPRSGCSSCAASGSCGTSLLDRVFSRRALELWVESDLSVRVGDQVVVGIEEGVLLRAAALAYLVPLVLMILAAGAVGPLLALLDFDAGELTAIIAAALGLSVGIALNRYSQPGRGCQARVIRRLPDGGTPPTIAVEDIK